MKIGFELPLVGPAISSADGLSAFCRALDYLGYDTLLDFAGQVVADGVIAGKLDGLGFHFFGV
jgi:hypothetical protein